MPRCAALRCAVQCCCAALSHAVRFSPRQAPPRPASTYSEFILDVTDCFRCVCATQPCAPSPSQGARTAPWATPGRSTPPATTRAPLSATCGKTGRRSSWRLTGASGPGLLALVPRCTRSGSGHAPKRRACCSRGEPRLRCRPGPLPCRRVARRTAGVSATLPAPPRPRWSPCPDTQPFVPPPRPNPPAPPPTNQPHPPPHFHLPAGSPPTTSSPPSCPSSSTPCSPCSSSRCRPATWTPAWASWSPSSCEPRRPPGL